MELDSWITIRKIKEETERFLGVPVNAQSLVFNGRRLPDNSQAAACGLASHSVQLLLPTAYTPPVIAALRARVRQNTRRQEPSPAGDPPRPPHFKEGVVQEPPYIAGDGGAGDPPGPSPAKKRACHPGQEPQYHDDAGVSGDTFQPPTPKRRACDPCEDPPAPATGDPALPGIGGDSSSRRSDRRQGSDVTGGEDSPGFMRGLEILEEERNSCYGWKRGSDVIFPAVFGGKDLLVPDLEFQAMEKNDRSSSRRLQWSDVILPAPGESGAEMDPQFLAGNIENGPPVTWPEILSPAAGASNADSSVLEPPFFAGNDEDDVTLPEIQLPAAGASNADSSISEPPFLAGIDEDDVTLPEIQLPVAGASYADSSVSEPPFLAGNDEDDVTLPEILLPPAGASNADSSVSEPPFSAGIDEDDVTLPEIRLPAAGASNADSSVSEPPFLAGNDEDDVTLPEILSPAYLAQNDEGMRDVTSMALEDWSIPESDFEILRMHLNPSPAGPQGTSDVTIPINPPEFNPILGRRQAHEARIAAIRRALGKIVVMVLPKDGKLKIPVEVRTRERVRELRKKLERLQIELPPDGYFFIHNQRVMEEELSFLMNGVVSGDTIDVFNGYVTSGSPE